MPSHALRRQLPLWITFVLTAMVVAIVWTAYYELHRSIFSSVVTRLRVAAGEVNTLLDAGIVRSTGEVAKVAERPELARVLSMETPETRAAALAALRSARGTSAAIALWTASGDLIVGDGPDSVVAAVRPHGTPQWNNGTAVGKFVAIDSGFGYAVMAPVRIRGQPVGIVGRVQRNNANGNNGAAVIARLVGKGTHLLVGNADGDLWTDLSRPVRAPAPHPSLQPSEFTTAGSTQALGFSTPVTGTPWVIWMDLPEESSSLGAVHHFRRTGILIALVAALLGTCATLFLVRRVARDVSSAQLAERTELLESKNAELRQREERLRQLVEHSPDAILVHRDGKIIFANEVAARVLGVDSVDAVIGRSLFDHIDPAERDEGTARLGEGAGFEVPTPLAEVRLVRATGVKAIVEATAMGVMFDGGPAVQTILRDVTERRLLEDQLRQSQKMEAVGRLAGGVAHDFNNLLTVIHTYTDILLSTTAADDPHRADLEEILHASKSAAALTRQMLAFSRKQVLAPQRVDLSVATKGVIGMIKRIIGDNIEVKTSLRDDIAPIWADAGQLEQVLINLAVNARDAMPTGGLLKIETANVRLEHGNASYHGQSIPPGEYAMLSVADTGVGMPDDVRRQIFEPFFTTKEAGRGTGLGLSTVYGIVKQSEGYIWVYSEPGHGSVFKIYFPRYTGDDTVVTTRMPEPRLRHDRGASILLVEDEPHVRGAVRRVLESRGFRVTEADQPSAALTLFMDPARNFDLVITDMMMPQKTGAELVRDLSERRSGLRAIIMSGYSEEATSRQWRLPPQALFIEKPIEPADLFRKINEAFGWAD